MKRYFGNFIDVLCLASCGVFACILTDTVPDALLGMMDTTAWIVAGVSLLLLLVLPRLTKAVWNSVFCVVGMVLCTGLFAWASQGVVLPPALKALAEPYTIPVLWENGSYYLLGSFGLLWVMGALCSLGFWRIVLTSLGCYAVWMLLSLGLFIGGQAWLGMQDAPLADWQHLLVEFPWISAAIPGVFVSLYGILMSMYDGFCTPYPGSRPKSGAELNPVPAPAPAPAPQESPAAK